MVLTNSFIESKWCMFETHLAQSRMILQTRDSSSCDQGSMILILKDKNLVVGKLDKNLRYILKTWTYIEWSPADGHEKLFWKRLKSSCMPFNNNSNSPHDSVGEEDKRQTINARTLSD